jgi:protein SCO1/2
MSFKINSFRKIHVFIIVGLLALLPIWLQRYKKHPLPIYGQVQNFTLQDSNGKSFTQDQIKGKIWVADLIFTTCMGPCPMMSKKLANLHRSFLLENDVRMVSFSVNPEVDTPEVMKVYAKRYEADTEKWHFLTGSRKEVTRLALEDFRMGDLDNIVFHSTYFVLVDELMRIRGYYDARDDAKIKQLFIDLAYLSKQLKKKRK